MARISGIDLPSDKRGVIGLTYMYGIGKSTAEKILAEANIDVNIRVSQWTPKDITAIRKIIEEKYRVEGTLRSDINGNIRRMIEIGSYRGVRHRKGLPVRGQRTQTNARTRKGKRKTVTGKKKVLKK